MRCLRVDFCNVEVESVVGVGFGCCFSSWKNNNSENIGCKPIEKADESVLVQTKDRFFQVFGGKMKP